MKSESTVFFCELCGFWEVDPVGLEGFYGCFATEKEAQAAADVWDLKGYTDAYCVPGNYVEVRDLSGVGVAWGATRAEAWSNAQVAVRPVLAA